MHRNTFVILSLIFALSVVVRLPLLNRPLSKHHEFNAAMALNVCNSWQLNGGPGATHLVPLINYGNPGDNYYAPHRYVKDGRVHYLSFGPMQFLLPYYTAKLFAVSPTPLLLQITGLLLHFICVLLFYAIVLLLLRHHPKVKSIALLSGIFFCYMPGALWFFGNGYVHEAVVLPFVLGIVYTYLRYTTLGGNKWLLLLILLITGGVYTDWLTLFITASLAAHSFFSYYRQQKKRYFITAGITIAATTLLALASLLWLYGSYFGTSALTAYFSGATASRQFGGGDAHYRFPGILIFYGKHLLTTGLPVVLPALAALFFIRLKKLWKTPYSILIFLLAGTTAYFLLFAQFSAEHEYSVIKFSYFTAFAAAWVLVRIFTQKQLVIITTILLAGSLVVFYYINRPGNTARNNDAYNTEAAWGQEIATQTKGDEVLIMDLHSENTAAVMYYAKRNIFYFPSTQEALDYLQICPLKKYCFIHINAQKQLRFEHGSR
jgi:hypothetical protein